MMNLENKKKLTPREEDVLILLMKGLSYTDIAKKLFVERTTVLTHVLRIYQKLNVDNRWELMSNKIKELENTIKELKGTVSNTRA